MPLFTLLFLAILGLIIFQLISRYVKNEKSPVVATRAQLMQKRCEPHTSMDANGIPLTTYSWYLLFLLDTGSTLELSVPERIHRHMVEQEWGLLTFQGTRFLRFEGPSGIYEK